MKEIFTDKMLLEMFNAIMKGETFNYSDDKTSVKITPDGIQIHYNSMKSSKDDEISAFLDYCNKLDDEFFVEVCDTFTAEELTKLQNQLDTDNYKNAIEVFTNRIKKVAKTNLESIINEADVEIKNLENTILVSQNRIEEIHRLLEVATLKYKC